MRKTPGYRSSKGTLEKLAHGYLLYEIPGTETGDWDSFSIRTLAQRLQNGGAAERRVVAEIAQAKGGGSEARYLRWMQREKALRGKVLAGGSANSNKRSR